MAGIDSIEFIYSPYRLGNPKAAANVAVDLQCWTL